jgi:hypothetical protein
VRLVPRPSTITRTLPAAHPSPGTDVVRLRPPLEECQLRHTLGARRMGSSGGPREFLVHFYGIKRRKVRPEVIVAPWCLGVSANIANKATNR